MRVRLLVNNANGNFNGYFLCIHERETPDQYLPHQLYIYGDVTLYYTLYFFITVSISIS